MITVTDIIRRQETIDNHRQDQWSRSGMTIALLDARDIARGKMRDEIIDELAEALRALYEARAQNESTKLRDDLDELRNELKDVERDKEEAETEQDRLEKELDEARDELREKDDEIAELKKRIEELEGDDDGSE